MHFIYPNSYNVSFLFKKERPIFNLYLTPTIPVGGSYRILYPVRIQLHTYYAGNLYRQIKWRTSMVLSTDNTSQDLNMCSVWGLKFRLNRPPVLQLCVWQLFQNKIILFQDNYIQHILLWPTVKFFNMEILYTH